MPTWLKCAITGLAAACLLVAVSAQSMSRRGLSGKPPVWQLDSDEAPLKGEITAVTQSSDGTLLVGADDLASFDGYIWHTIPMPGTGRVSALAPARSSPGMTNRVWVCAEGAIGWVERDATGEWKYTPLSPISGDPQLPPLEGLSSVGAVANGAIWIARNHVIRWQPIHPPENKGTAPPETGHGAAAEDGRLESWALPADEPLKGFPIGNVMAVYQAGVGLLEFSASGEPRLACSDGLMPGRELRWIVPLNNPANPDRLGLDTGAELLIGIGDAAYRWRVGSGFAKLKELSSVLLNTNPTGAIALADGRVAIATAKSGIMLTNAGSQFLGVISTRNGLADDDVLGLWANEHHLWAALGASGLARIDGNGRVMRFDRESGLTFGAPLTAVNYQGRAYPLTSRRFFRALVQPSKDEIQLAEILSTTTSFSDAISTDDSLWLAEQNELWRIDAMGGLQRIYHGKSPIERLAPSATHPGGLMMVAGGRIELLRSVGENDWAWVDLGAEVPAPATALLEGPDGDVWVQTRRDGLLRFAWLNSGPEPILQRKRHFREGDGLPLKANSTKITALGDRIFLFSDKGILTLSADADKFVPAPEFADFAGIASSPAFPTGKHRDEAQAYWLVQSHALKATGIQAILHVSLKQGRLTTKAVDVPGLDSLGTAYGLAWAGSTNEAIKSSEDPTLWIYGRRGFLRIDEALLCVAAVPVGQALGIRFGQNRSSGPSGGDILVNVLQFPLPAAAGGEPVFYQSKLRDFEGDWTAPTTTAARKFVALRPGNYHFEVRMLNRFGVSISQCALDFSIQAPWYLTPWAFALDALILLLTGAAVARHRVARLKEQRNMLNRLVSERTRELELSNTAKNKFLENVSHELRNPLNGILGMVGMLKESRLSEDDGALVRALKMCAERMALAFDDVLGLSKLEYGDATVERIPFSLRATLEEVVSLHEPTAVARKCPMSIIWPESLADGFIGDAPKIKAVVSNFVTNAYKYAPGTPITLNVEAHPAEPITAGEQAHAGAEGMMNVVIEVSDQGPGIAAEEQELIFKKFVRGSKAKEQNVVGTGLGLATCRALASILNGSVGVESVAGHGATFYLRVLMPQSALQAPHPEVRSRPLPKDAAVLIVEDEPYNQAVLAEIVRKLGYRPAVAASAEEAETALSGQSFDVILLDWELPGSNGGEIARRARRAGNNAIILATTAHDSDTIRGRCRAAGMNGFILKPYSLGKIKHTMERALPMTISTDPSHVSSLIAVAETSSADESERLNLEAFEHYANAHISRGESPVTSYCNSVQHEIDALARAVSVDKPSSIVRSAHRLRSLAGLIGAKKFNQSATALEQFGRSGTTQERVAQFTEVLATWKGLQEKLSQHCPP